MIILTMAGNPTQCWRSAGMEKTFETKKLLMTNADYPWDLTCHVRDPKVWKQDDTYYMVQGARTKGRQRVVLVFSSEDKEHWKCIHRLQSEETFGFMWECPDLYELDGYTVLSIFSSGTGSRRMEIPQSVSDSSRHYSWRFPDRWSTRSISGD